MIPEEDGATTRLEPMTWMDEVRAVKQVRVVSQSPRARRGVGAKVS